MEKNYIRDLSEIVGELSSEEKTQWKELEQRYGPIIINDRFGEVENSGDVINLAEVGWCNLYPLGILILEYLNGINSSVYTETQNPHVTSNIDQTFIEKRDSKFRYFRAFLDEWKISPLLDISKIKIELSDILGRNMSSNRFEGSDSENDLDQDKKILGLNTFRKQEDLDEYVLLWKKNDNVENSGILSNRLISSRGIDLICSELIANAIEHGLNEVQERENARYSSNGPNAFILAKLVSQRSIKEALRIHRKKKTLSGHEVKFYTSALQNNEPIIQIVIADPGKGFGGNERLRAQYLDEKKEKNSKDNKSVTEGELIQFALRPDVSTKILKEMSKNKKDENRKEKLNEYLRILSSQYSEKIEAPNVHSYIHGMSEVRMFVKEFQGFWRIHSNDVYYDLNYYNSEAPKDRPKNGRQIPGCLHYIMLPLKAKKFKRSNFLSVGINKESTEIVSMSSFLYSEIYDRKPTKDQVLFSMFQTCEYLLKFAKNHNDSKNSISSILLDVSPLARFNGDNSLISDCCVMLAFTLGQLRDLVAIYICGANDLVRSKLQSFIKWKEHYFSRRVIPFFSQYSETGDFKIEIVVSEELMHLKEILEDVLTPRKEKLEIFKSSYSEDWKILTEIEAHNQGLFWIQDEKNDSRFGGKLDLEKTDPTIFRSLMSSETPEELQADLLRNQAIIFPHKSIRRFDVNLDFYIHLAFLWADDSFRNRLTDWMITATKNIDGLVVEDGGKGIVFIPLLHPAIELVRALLRKHEFNNASMTEIRRMSELRWDNPGILKLKKFKSEKIICVIDVVDSGKTIQKLIESLDFLGLKPSAILSIIRIGETEQQLSPGIPFLSFCETTHSKIVELKARIGNSPKEYKLIDADSQVTISYSDKILSFLNSWMSKNHDDELVKEKRLEALIENEVLRFSHGIYGNLHHIFFVLLKKYKQNIFKDITDDIKSLVNRESKIPDFILYPGESTISYIVENSGDDLLCDLKKLFAREKLIVLGPSKRSYGNFELQMEISGKQRDVLMEKRGIRVLFIDDSLNSGRTVAKAREAFCEFRKKYFSEKAQDEWMVYVVLRRGKRIAPVRNGEDLKISFPYDVSEGDFIKSYCDIGPQTMTVETCPFVSAQRHLVKVCRLLTNFRSKVTEIVERLYDLIDGVNIESIKMNKRLLGRESLILLLNLYELDIPFAYLRISNTQELNVKQLDASLMYIALNYSDIMTYLSHEKLFEIAQKYVDHFFDDDQKRYIVLLTVLLILPCSVSFEIVQRILEKLSVNKNPNTIIAMLAIVFSKFDSIIQENVREFSQIHKLENSSMGYSKNFLHSQRIYLIECINKILLKLKKNENEDIKDFAWLISASFRIISAAPQTEDIVVAAKKYISLIYENYNHPSFLHKRVAELSKENGYNVIRTLKNAIQLTKNFYEQLYIKPEEQILEFELYLNTLNEGQLRLSGETYQNFKKKTTIWLEFQTSFSKIRPFFYSPLRLFDLIKSCHSHLLYDYSIYELPNSIYYLLPKIENKIRKWNCLAPNREILKDLFLNLFYNPIKYYNGKNSESNNIEDQIRNLRQKSSPLVVCFFYIDYESDSLVIAFANRSKKIMDERNVFFPSCGLGNSKLRFNYFGGDIEILSTEDGLNEFSIKKHVPVQLKDAIKVPEDYKNIFITKLPLIWETRL